MKKAFLLFTLIAFCGLKTSLAQWAASGTNIYNTNTGYVGIGNNSPQTLLYVAKNMAEPNITVRNMGGTGGATYTMVDDASGANWKFKATTDGGFKIRDHANGMDVLVIEPNSAANSIYIDDEGRVGIGTSFMHYKFNVVGGDAEINYTIIGKGGGGKYTNIVLGTIGTLAHNQTGDHNTALGVGCLQENLSGACNIAVGECALVDNINGFYNTGVGVNALCMNGSGGYNSALGYNTGFSHNLNYSNTTCLGTDATATANDMVRIGNVWVGSIGGYQDWTNISDGRFKDDVRDDVPGMEFISRLRPVTYRLDREEINEFTGVNARHEMIREKDPKTEFLTGERYSPVTTGFIAQEVEQAAKSCDFDFSGVDAPDNPNDLYGLRYAEFVVPLVKAVQEQQAEIEVQHAEIESLKARIEELEGKSK